MKMGQRPALVTAVAKRDCIKGRCCMDRVSAEFSHAPDGLRRNVETADRVRATRVEHSIEDGHADSRFGPLTREAARA